MIDNEALQEELEEQQQPSELETLEMAFLAALVLSVTDLYGSYETDEGLNINKGNRKKAFFSRVVGIVSTHYKAVSELVTSNSAESFKKAYEQFMEAYAEELELPLIQVVTGELINQALENGFPLSQTMDHNKRLTTRKLRQSFVEAFRRNEAVEEVVNRVTEVAQNDANRVRTVVQEESARMQNEAQTESIIAAEEQGVNVEVIWNSMRDGKVRKAHQELNGQKADADGWFYVNGDKAKHPHGFSKIGLNIRCRCYLEIRGVNVADSEIARELNSAESSAARREVWERRRALARERARGDIS